jgi:hypothetical protein
MTIRTNQLVVAAAAVIMAAGIGSGAAFSPRSAPVAADDSFVVLAQSKMIHPKASLSMKARQSRAATIRRLPGALASTGRGPVAVLKEDCQFTNDMIAQCIVWDCDDDDVCVEYGQYCVDNNGNTIPCP